jgi:hypothetical protein
MKKTYFQSMLFLGFCFFSCQSNTHQWENITYETFNDKNVLSYDVIKDEYKKHYISLLESKAYIEITKDEAKKISTKFLDGDNKKIIVVRAIYPRKGGSYFIRFNDKNDIYIKYYQMGSKGLRIHKDALVLKVDKMPPNVYISYILAK